MSDRTVIFGILRAMPGVLFIEPGADLVMQDEVHHQARHEREKRGLPKSYPYIGWHTQSNAFDRGGALVGSQYVYFGGNRDAVARALRALEPHGYAIGGGHGDSEAFRLHRDAEPVRVAADTIAAWRTRLAVLADDPHIPPRPHETGHVREIIARRDFWELLPNAVRALRIRGALTGADIEAVLSAPGLDALAASAGEVVAHALEIGHPAAADAAAKLAADGRIDARLLRLWGGPRALQVAHTAARSGSFVAEYLDLVAASGDDPIVAAVRLAEEARDAADAAADATIRRIAALMVPRYGAPESNNAVAAMSDERIPVWLRVVVGDVHTTLPAAAGTKTGQGGSEQIKVPELTRAVDVVRARAGIEPTPGFDVRNRRAQVAAIEQRESVVAAHADGLRAALARTDLQEPDIAVLLELLYGAGALRANDLAPLAKGWRKRLFVKPSPYTPAAPAVVTYATALSTFDDRKSEAIAEIVERDTRKWTRPVWHMLQGALDRGRDADLAAEAQLIRSAHTGSPHAAVHALCRVRARLWRVSPVTAACASLLEAPERPAYVRNGFAAAAIAFAQGGCGLGAHFFQDGSARAFDAGLRIAESPEYPITARRVVLAVAKRSKVITHPTDVPTDEVERLRRRWRDVSAMLAQ